MIDQLDVAVVAMVVLLLVFSMMLVYNLFESNLAPYRDNHKPCDLNDGACVK